MATWVKEHMQVKSEVALEIWVDNSDDSVDKSSKSETDPSRMVDVMEDVETLGDVLVKATEVDLEDSDGVTINADDGTCNKGEQSVGGRDGGDDTDTIAVGVRENDEETEVADSLEGLLSIVLSWLGSLGFRKIYGLHRRGSC